LQPFVADGPSRSSSDGTAYQAALAGPIALTWVITAVLPGMTLTSGSATIEAQ